MQFTEVFVGLGGNIGDTQLVLQKALKSIELLPGIESVRVSRFYATTPVGVQTQDCFMNAICSFKTTYTAVELLEHLQDIETALGKVPKAKNRSRIIDLDILFFGREKYSTSDLEVPHPRWKERLFVLVPLLDLTARIELPGNELVDLTQFIKEFSNPHNETVSLIQEKVAI